MTTLLLLLLDQILASHLPQNGLLETKLSQRQLLKICGSHFSLFDGVALSMSTRDITVAAAATAFFDLTASASLVIVHVSHPFLRTAPRHLRSTFGGISDGPISHHTPIATIDSQMLSSRLRRMIVRCGWTPRYLLLSSSHQPYNHLYTWSVCGLRLIASVLLQSLHRALKAIRLVSEQQPRGRCQFASNEHRPVRLVCLSLSPPCTTV